MAQVKNISIQPVYLDLSNGRTLKIPARSTANLEETDLDSPAVLFHLSHGTLIVVEREEP